jgi:hypothetical protein
MRPAVFRREADEEDGQEQRDRLQRIESAFGSADTEAEDNNSAHSRDMGFPMIQPARPVSIRDWDPGRICLLRRTSSGMTKSAIWMHEPTETASARSTLFRYATNTAVTCSAALPTLRAGKRTACNTDAETYTASKTRPSHSGLTEPD